MIIDVVPQTVFQVGAMLLLVVPGFVYTGTRRHLRGGATADEKEFSVRLVHGIAASVVLNSLYLVIAGPYLMKLLNRGGDSQDGLAEVTAHPRELGVVVSVLAIIAPAVLAATVNWVSTSDRMTDLRKRLPFSPIPSAWDMVVPYRANCFIRIRTDDGHWVGGYINDQETYFSTYPEPRDVFIPEEWEMDKYGTFIRPVPNSQGIFVPLSGSERVSWLSAS